MCSKGVLQFSWNFVGKILVANGKFQQNKAQAKTVDFFHWRFGDASKIS